MPRATSSSQRSGGRGATRRAIGRPCSVTVNSSPTLTRSRYRLRWSRSSRTPTSRSDPEWTAGSREGSPDTAGRPRGHGLAGPTAAVPTRAPDRSRRMWRHCGVFLTVHVAILHQPIHRPRIAHSPRPTGAAAGPCPGSRARSRPRRGAPATDARGREARRRRGRERARGADPRRGARRAPRGRAPERSGSSAAGKVARPFPPRSTYRTATPSTSTTYAPAARWNGRRSSSPRRGQGSAAPYGWAGSAAARRSTRGRSASGSRAARSRSIAPARANCAAPSPSTK